LSVTLTRAGETFQIHVASTVPGREFADALIRVTTDHPLGRIIEIPVRIIDSPVIKGARP
jgi:phosphoribosyl-dephospho-CoA transferase